MKNLNHLAVLWALSTSAAALAAPAPASAQSVTAFKNAKVLVASKFTVCSTEARSDIAKLTNVGANSGSRPDLTSEKCIAEGKDLVKSAFDEIKSGYGKVKPPKDLVEWRLEWTAAFDAAKPQNTDTESSYVRRTEDAKQKSLRATTRLEMGLE